MSTGLSKEALLLVRAGRQALRPSASDKLRVHQALQSRLQTLSSGAAFQPSLVPASKASAALWPKLVALVGVVGVGAATTVMLLQKESKPEASAAPSATVSPPAEPRASVEPPSAPAPVSTLVPSSDSERVVEPSTAQAQRAPRTVDPLQAEVALLKRAQKEYQSGKYNSVLSSVDEHRRRFPSGALAKEASTLRARASCALGKSEAASGASGLEERAAVGTKPSPASPCRDVN